MSELPDYELLSPYLDGELTADEEARVERMLADDPAARQLLDELRALSGTLQNLPAQKPAQNLSGWIVEAAVARKAGLSAAAAPVEPATVASRTAPGMWREFSWRGMLSRRALFWSGVAIAVAIYLQLTDPAKKGNPLPQQIAKSEATKSAPSERQLAESDRMRRVEPSIHAPETPASAPVPTKPMPGPVVNSPEGRVAGLNLYTAPNSVESSSLVMTKTEGAKHPAIEMKDAIALQQEALKADVGYKSPITVSAGTLAYGPPMVAQQGGAPASRSMPPALGASDPTGSAAKPAAEAPAPIVPALATPAPATTAPVTPAPLMPAPEALVVNGSRGGGDRPMQEHVEEEKSSRSVTMPAPAAAPAPRPEPPASVAVSGKAPAGPAESAVEAKPSIEAVAQAPAPRGRLAVSRAMKRGGQPMAKPSGDGQIADAPASRWEENHKQQFFGQGMGGMGGGAGAFGGQPMPSRAKAGAVPTNRHVVHVEVRPAAIPLFESLLREQPQQPRELSRVHDQELLAQKSDDYRFNVQRRAEQPKAAAPAAEEATLGSMKAEQKPVEETAGMHVYEFVGTAEQVQTMLEKLDKKLAVVQMPGRAQFAFSDDQLDSSNKAPSHAFLESDVAKAMPADKKPETVVHWRLELQVVEPAMADKLLAAPADAAPAAPAAARPLPAAPAPVKP